MQQPQINEIFIERQNKKLNYYTLLDNGPKSGALTKTKSGPRATMHGRGVFVGGAFSEFWF